MYLIKLFVKEGPSLFFESTRRKLFADIKDLKFFINSQLNTNNRLRPNLESKESEYFKSAINERIDFLFVQIHNLSTSDNLGKWRHSESKLLAEKVQQDFHNIQNPHDCSTAKKLMCDLNKSCGYGCQIHHIMYCFIVSYFTKRTMILQSNNWRYNPKGFSAYYLPLSNTCTDVQGQEYIDWTSKFWKILLLMFPIHS